MKVTYDPTADAMAIRFSDVKKSDKTEELSGDFLPFSETVLSH